MKNQLEQVLNIVCEFYNISTDEIKGTCRKSNLVKARHVFFYLSYIVLEKSLYEISVVSQNNHTSVLHGRNKIADEIRFYPKLKREVEELKLKILSLNNVVVEHVDLVQLSINNTFSTI